MAIATILAVFGATTPVVAQGASQGVPPNTKPAEADVKGEEASSPKPEQQRPSTWGEPTEVLGPEAARSRRSQETSPAPNSS